MLLNNSLQSVAQMQRGIQATCDMEKIMHELQNNGKEQQHSEAIIL